jgi:hypothetical protein
MYCSGRRRLPTGVGGLLVCGVKGIDNDSNINSKLRPQKTSSFLAYSSTTRRRYPHDQQSFYSTLVACYGASKEER